jgi:hypothetical protein
VQKYIILTVGKVLSDSFPMHGYREGRPRKGLITAPWLLMTTSATAPGAVSTAEVAATAKAWRGHLRCGPVLLRVRGSFFVHPDILI